MTERFRRDRLTWIAYVMLAWFAYLQAAPGLVMVHLRDELDLSYSAGGLHVAAFAAGSMIAGVVSASIDSAVALMGSSFGGVVVGCVIGSRLDFRKAPAGALALALAVTAAGFAVLWP